MPKGMFTQGLCVFFEAPVSIDAIETALADYEIRGSKEAADEWAYGGPSLLISYRPDCNGNVTVDVVEEPWPDHMGDPKSDFHIFGAWTMGFFGPFAYPHGLKRAVQQSWSWRDAEAVMDRQACFVRIRSSYVLGGEESDPVVPEDYAALPELEFTTQIAARLLDLPGAICYFNPGGEVLRDKDGLVEAIEFGRESGLPPLDIWSNVRLFQYSEAWSLMDTVGNGQLDLPDIEAAFHTQSYDPNDVGNYLRNVSLYLLNNGEVIKDGDTMDGPGGVRWQAKSFQNGLADPPRSTMRWLAIDSHRVPEEILKGDEEE